MIPVTSAGNWQGDSVIETAHTSGFATVAKRGETLGDNYVQANNCHKNHISPDNIIDASTCFTPESTWFIKNANHVGVTDGNAEFFVWLMTSKEQCSVYSNPLYPQFMYYNTDNDYLAPYLYSFGDVDLNGNINLVDVRLALRQSLGRETLAKLSLCQADFDIDGAVTKDEAIKIMEIA